MSRLLGTAQLYLPMVYLRAPLGVFWLEPLLKARRAEEPEEWTHEPLIVALFHALVLAPARPRAHDHDISPAFISRHRDLIGACST